VRNGGAPLSDLLLHESAVALSFLQRETIVFNTVPPPQNWADLLAQLQRVDALLHDGVERLRQLKPADAGEFRGLFISDQEFKEMLARPFGYSALAGSHSHDDTSAAQAADSRWHYLVHTFDLSSLEADILLLCLLPELDLKYERIFAYLQDDVTRKRPGVDLALNLFCSDLPSRLQGRSAFLPDAPLFRYRLLCQGDGQLSLLAQTLQVEPRVVSFLLEADGRTSYLPVYLTMEKPQVTLGELALSPDLMSQVESLSHASTALWVHLQGQGWMALQCARALCAAWGTSLLRIDAGAADAKQEVVRDRAEVARRESRLAGAALYIDVSPVDERGERAPPSAHDISAPWLELFRGHPHPIFWRMSSPLPLGQKGLYPNIVRLAFGPPDYAQRLALWRSALAATPLAVGLELETLAGRYRLSGRQIEESSGAARQAAWQRNPENPIVTFHDLSLAARASTTSQLGELAQRIEPRHGWADLVLPDDRLAQLQEMCDQFRYRHIVYDEWGFGRRSLAGRGLSALFAGPSGTGKTMAAEIIANELELNLYRIDLSAVVSKYIGETEKNLKRVFDAAEGGNDILLFDEADALFGKRSETKDAHDRYANIEVSYLLQKIEAYGGVAILTSNLRKNLDEAFMRRLHFTIEFPFPDEKARLQIWQKVLPDQAPVGEDIDLDDLAIRFKFSGGSIRNVWVNAAFLAAREGEPVTTRIPKAGQAGR